MKFNLIAKKGLIKDYYTGLTREEAIKKRKSLVKLGYDVKAQEQIKYK